MENKLLFAAIITALTLSTNISNASPYIKVFAGNTSSNIDYNSTTPWYDTSTTNALFALTKSSMLMNENSVTAGAGVGFETKLTPNVSWGLDLEGIKQLEKSEFSEHIDSRNTSLAGGLLAKTKTRNDYNARLSLVLGLGEMLYIKAGPAILRQNYTTEIGDPANIAFNPAVKISDRRTFMGLSGGLGLKYNLSEVFSIYAEFNHTYFKKEQLSDIAIPAARLETPTAGDGDVTRYEDRSFKYSQSMIYAGIRINLLN